MQHILSSAACLLLVLSTRSIHGQPTPPTITKISRSIPNVDGTSLFSMYFRGDVLLLDRLEIKREDEIAYIREQFHLENSRVLTRLLNSSGAEGQTVSGNPGVTVFLSRYSDDIYPRHLLLLNKNGVQENFELLNSRFEPIDKSELDKRSIIVLGGLSQSGEDEVWRQIQQEQIQTEQGAAANP